jgi:L-rhamnose isomerase/sugar isomerase
VIHQLARATPTVSLHIPWDKCERLEELRAGRTSLRAWASTPINSNTFSDQKGQAHSYKFGSLTHTDAATRAQASGAQHRLHRIGQDRCSRR